MTVEAKPFIKWVGGKRQLIPDLEALLPTDFSSREGVTYIEPFVGGGAMLFHLLQEYKNITSAVVNDINHDLTTCYRIVRDQPARLLGALKELQEEYYSTPTLDGKKAMFLNKRALYNTTATDDTERTALFLFLNRTCFNGLYRVNKSGQFNVPFGRYARPTIYNPDVIYADSALLQNVEIMTGDFEQTLSRVTASALIYLDPPYRPISETSNFNDYAKEGFNDDDQKRLKAFCDKIDDIGATFLLSNSDCLAANGTDRFFDDLYGNYQIKRLWASRNVNANPDKRGKISEIAVFNRQQNDVPANVTP